MGNKTTQSQSWGTMVLTESKKHHQFSLMKVFIQGQKYKGIGTDALFM